MGAGGRNIGGRNISSDGPATAQQQCNNGGSDGTVTAAATLAATLTGSSDDPANAQERRSNGNYDGTATGEAEAQ